ncbi:MAG: ABC transporter ATP-binding protein [Acidobacteria bacterium]|nr:ABC transporter ATP-binding protein [Acidobacteriota bacterium]
MTPLLALNLSASYGGKSPVLSGLSLEIGRGEILGLVGESGCGKSTLALAILRLLPVKNAYVEGSIEFNGRDLMLLSEGEMRRVRGKEIGLVLQSPMSALNPALRVGAQLEEAWRVHQRGTKDARKRDLVSALANARLPHAEEFFRRYPAQLSVGQAQRVLIAMAMLHHPALLICDEPTSSLDLVTQSDIVELFRELKTKLATSILFISHDLLSVANLCQRIAVMKDGAIVECRSTKDLFFDPQHPYTQQLLRALPAVPRFAAKAAAANS